MNLAISDYTYTLPEERIALHPLPERDKSKLLLYRKGDISHTSFSNIIDELPSDATMFFNNSKVIMARMLFEKESGAQIEIFLLNPVQPSTLLLDAMQSTSQCAWHCAIGNRKRWKEGIVLKKEIGGEQITATFDDRDNDIIQFEWTGGQTFASIIERIGKVPLPPYLNREPVAEDQQRYQTVYSNIEGAVAAPTAGLHFTENVLNALREKGVREEFLTLHVSAGTFQPVKSSNAAEHTMHQEQIVVTESNVQALLEGRFIVPVGTTSMRTLESLYWYGVKLTVDENAPFFITQQDAYTLPQDISMKTSLEAVLDKINKEGKGSITGETSIYIMPGYTFRICNALVTNFHQPGSTLILLVAAFVGEAWRSIYQEALDNQYRFLSYGDSSLLIP